MRIRKILAGAAAGMCVVTAGVFYACTTGGNSASMNYPDESATEETNYDTDITVDYTGADVYRVCVYVCGCVAKPGVFYLDKGARVYDAIQLAGGITDDGDMRAVNQAETVADGQQIYVPFIEEGQGVAAEDGSDTRVNINTADISQLTTLPGIGESRAKTIIAYREEHGAFKDVSDIMNVTGIKEASYNKIKDLIRVN